jgi:hypothetical protein
MATCLLVTSNTLFVRVKGLESRKTDRNYKGAASQDCDLLKKLIAEYADLVAYNMLKLMRTAAIGTTLSNGWSVHTSKRTLAWFCSKGTH